MSQNNQGVIENEIVGFDEKSEKSGEDTIVIEEILVEPLDKKPRKAVDKVKAKVQLLAKQIAEKKAENEIELEKELSVVKKSIENKQIYNSVIITNKARTYNYTCGNVKDYLNEIKKTPNSPELIGSFRQQVKPCFDVDAYNQDVDVGEIVAKINILFPNKK